MWFGNPFYSIYIRFSRLVMVGTMISFFNLNTFTFGCSYRIIWFSNGKGYKNEHLYENHGWEIFQDEAHFWKKIEYFIKLIFEIQNDKIFRYMLVLAKDSYHLIKTKSKHSDNVYYCPFWYTSLCQTKHTTWPPCTNFDHQQSKPLQRTLP